MMRLRQISEALQPNFKNGFPRPLCGADVLEYVKIYFVSVLFCLNRKPLKDDFIHVNRTKAEQHQNGTVTNCLFSTSVNNLFVHASI